MTKDVCVRCGWEYIGVKQGLVRGLCCTCTLVIKEKARDRGIYLDVPTDKKPPFPHREKKVDGIRLWWWKGIWRAEV